MNKSIIITFLSLLSLQVGYSQIKFEDISVKDALIKAKAENKKVFIDVYTTWCGPCKFMAANVFTDKKIGNRMNESYISLKIDYEKSPYRSEVSPYGIKGYPTMLILDTAGIEINRIYGSRSVSEFHNELDDMLGITTSPILIAFEEMKQNPDDQKLWKKNLGIIGDDWNVLNKHNLLDPYYEACKTYFTNFNIAHLKDDLDYKLFYSIILPIDNPAVQDYLTSKKDYGSYFHKDYMALQLKSEYEKATSKKEKQAVRQKAEEYFDLHEEKLHGDVEPRSFFMEQIFGK